jgi:hypothetical protein
MAMAICGHGFDTHSLFINAVRLAYRPARLYSFTWSGWEAMKRKDD